MKGPSTKTKSQETATTTPNLGAAAPLVNNYYGGLGNLSGNDLKLPANDLQTGLYGKGMAMLGQNGADNLAPAIQGTQTAMGLLGGAGPAALTQAQAPGGYNPAHATAATAQAPGAYNPAQAQMGQYGGVALAQAPDMPTAATADVRGIADGIGGGGYAGARALTYMGDYQNPFTEQVIDASLADLSNTQGADRAAYARRMASAGAFGGSRLGLGETNLIDAQNRTRNTLGYTMRADGWQRALDAGAGDADRANSAGIASANNATQASIARAGLLGDAELANMRAKNDFGLEGYRGGIDLAKANSGYLNDALASIFGAQNDINVENARSANDALGRQYSVNADMAQFNAGQANSMANSNADRANDMRSQVYSTDAALSQFNANQANQNAQFNSNLGVDRAQAYGGLAGQLGGLLNDAGQLDLSRLATMSGIAGDQRAIDLANSPAMQQMLLAQLISGGTLLGAQSGQTITSNGTSTSKQSGGLGSQLLGAAAQLGSAAMMASERRVKRDIVKLGEEADGLGVYRYNYVWDDMAEMPRFGVMVDEVEVLRPWALGPVVDGVQTVNYGAL